MSAVIEKPQTAPPSLVTKLAGRFGVAPEKMWVTLKATAFRGDVSNEQMMALLIVADQYNLNPWTREIYAFPDRQNGIVPVVGVDGWSRIINEHAEFDGMEFIDGPLDDHNLPAWIECVIHRKDRSHAIRAREYMAECKRNTPSWQSHPRRMLRHKSMIQCARIAFGYTGFYDQDEAERIVDMGEAQEVRKSDTAAVSDINARIAARRAAATDIEPATPQAEPAQPEPEAPAVTYAKVAAALNKARSIDTLDLAADLIGEVADEQQRSELTALYVRLKEKGWA